MNPIVPGHFKKKSDRKVQLIDLGKPREVAFWSKKWEISSPQLYKAYQETGSNNVFEIETYLKKIGLVS